MRNLGLYFLTALLLSCAASPQITQPQSAKKQARHGLSASVSHKDQCAELHQSGAPISLSFAMCTDVCWGFDFFPQPNLPKEDEFAWLCGRLDFVDTTVQLEALISPEDYQALPENLDRQDFFGLPTASANFLPVAPQAPHYIIEATRGGQKHRVTMQTDVAGQSPSELQRFKSVWDAFNALLPEPLRIALVP